MVVSCVNVPTTAEPRPGSAPRNKPELVASTTTTNVLVTGKLEGPTTTRLPPSGPCGANCAVAGEILPPATHQPLVGESITNVAVELWPRVLLAERFQTSPAASCGTTVVPMRFVIREKLPMPD